MFILTHLKKNDFRPMCAVDPDSIERSCDDPMREYCRQKEEQGDCGNCGLMVPDWKHESLVSSGSEIPLISRN